LFEIIGVDHWGAKPKTKIKKKQRKGKHHQTKNRVKVRGLSGSLEKNSIKEGGGRHGSGGTKYQEKIAAKRIEKRVKCLGGGSGISREELRGKLGKTISGGKGEPMIL